MAIDSTIPMISALRQLAEDTFGAPLKVHADFVALSESIFNKTRQHISETTLERLWNYSTRGYDTVSRRTLDVICTFCDLENWEVFLYKLKKEDNCESDMFDREAISVEGLATGSRLRIGWQPDRVCVIRYLGENRFVAEETQNSKLSPGDTFECMQFQIHSPAYLYNLKDEWGLQKGTRYGVGLSNGLTMLQLLD